MKIVDIKFTRGVESLGRENVNMPLAEAARNIALAGAIGSAADTTTDIAGSIYQRQVEMEVEAAQTKYWVANSEMAAEHAGKAFYSSDELPEGMQSEYGPGGDPLKSAYEVQPQLFRSRRLEFMENQAATISDPVAASKFRLATRELIEKRFAGDVVKAANQQIVVHRKRQDAMIDELKQQGAYDAALMIAQNFEGSQEEKNKRTYEINKQREEDPMSLSMANNNVVAMEAQLAVMKQDDEQYEGLLTQAERKSWAESLEDQIYEAGKAQRTAAAQAKTALEWRGRKMEQAYYTGKDQNEQSYQTLVRQLMATSPLQATELISSHAFQKGYKILSHAPKSVRTAVTSSVASATYDNPLEALNADKLETAAREMNSAQDTDTTSYAVSVGLIKHVPLDGKDLAKSIRGMTENDITVMKELKESTGPMPKNVEAELGTMMINAKDERTLAPIFGAIHAGAGDRAYRFFEQLQYDGIATSRSVAGQLWTDAPDVSRKILSGNKYRTQTYPKILKDIEPDLREEILTKLGTIYRDDPKKQSAMIPAILDLYTEQLVQHGQTADVIPGDINDDYLDSAIANATGGVQTVHGKQVLSAYRGQPEGELQKQFNRVNLDTLAKSGNPDGFTLPQLKQEIADADKVEAVSIGEGRYGLFYVPSNSFIFNKNDTLYELNLSGDVGMDPTLTQRTIASLEGGIEVTPFDADSIEAGAVEVAASIDSGLDSLGENIRETVSKYAGKLTNKLKQNKLLSDIEAEETKKAKEKSSNIKQLKKVLKEAGKTAGEIGDLLNTPLADISDKIIKKLQQNKKLSDAEAREVIDAKLKLREKGIPVDYVEEFFSAITRNPDLGPGSPNF